MLDDSREALEPRLDFLAEALDSLPGYVSFVDADLRYRWVNRLYESWYGRPRHEIVGQRLVDLMPPDLYAAGLVYFRRALAGERVQYQATVAGENGRLRIFDVTYTPNSDGSGFHVLSIERTDERRAEAELRLLAKVFETAAEGILLADAGQRVLSANPAFQAMTGFDANELAGRPVLGEGELLSIVESDPGSVPPPKRDGPFTGEVDVTRRDGSRFAAWVSMSPVAQPDGTVAHYVVIVTDIGPLKHSQQRLEALANYDALSGLPNRHLLSSRFRYALGAAQRSTQRPAILFVDLDDFKSVNDSVGHEAGDALLRQVSARLTGAVRQQDTVARVGGDEFVVLLDQVGSADVVRAMAQRVADAFRAPFTVAGRTHDVTVSIGVALCPDDGTDLQTLLRRADEAMYRVKERGRNGFCFYADPPAP